MPLQLQYVQLTGKTDAADLTCCVFAILFSVTRTKKIQNSLPCHAFHQNMANGDVTKEALNCTASL